MGKYAVAGQRFESFRPGYQVVKDQEDVPRHALPVLSAGITSDNRTVVLQTAGANRSCKLRRDDPHAPGAGPGKTTLAHLRHKMTWISFRLTGVETKVDPAWVKKAGAVGCRFGSSRWRGLSLLPAKNIGRCSNACKNPARSSSVANSTLVNAASHDSTRCKIGLQIPPETVTVVFKSNVRLDLKNCPQVRIKRSAPGKCG